MLIQNEINMVNDVLDNMDSESLATIGRLMYAVSVDETNTLGHYWRGTIDTRLRARGACTRCGGDSITHEHDSSGATVSLQPEVKEAESKSKFIQDTLFDEAEGIEGGDPVENILKNAEEWGVRFVDPESLRGEVECINCGTRNVSLEDRMLRDPKADGCLGCQQKSMWG